MLLKPFDLQQMRIISTGAVVLAAALLVAAVPSSQAASIPVDATDVTLQGSLHIEAAFDVPVDDPDVAFIGPANTRGPGAAGGGNANTFGTILGQANVLAGQAVGEGSGNDGVNLTTFGGSTNFIDLDRFASEDNQALITYDFDFSSLFTGPGALVVGSGSGETGFSLELDFSAPGGNNFTDYNFFISFNGTGTTLDATDVSTITGSDTSGLVGDATLYQPIGSINNEVAGTAGFDLTAAFAEIAAGDGQFRLAISSTGFNNDLSFLNATGVTSFTNPVGEVIPEPSSLVLLGLSGFGLTLRGRRRVS